MNVLDIPVPPMLEAAVGVPDTPARLVAFYWTPCGDEVCYDDGRSSGTGGSHAFLIYRRHPAVEPVLARYDLGSSDAEAEYWLLLDRQARRMSVGPVAEVRRQLHGQWPPTDPITLTDAEWDAIVAEIRSRPAPTADQIMAAMTEQRRLERELAAWLDNCPHVEAAREAFRRWVEGDG